MNQEVVKDYLTSKVYRGIVSVVGDNDDGKKLQVYCLAYDNLIDKIEASEDIKDGTLRRSIMLYSGSKLVTELVIFLDRK